MKSRLNLTILVTLVFWGLTSQANFAQKKTQPRLNVWIHGTTIRTVIPFKITGFHHDSALVSITDIPKKTEIYRRALSLTNGNAQAFPLEAFYSFRWSGLLSYRERTKASKDLYQALIEKINLIKTTTGQEPIVNLFTHSHGGNVALNLAQINQQTGNQLKIDRLVLLGCPIQERTADLVYNETFNKVYVFNSDLDFIQPLALQGFIKPAKRKFSKHDFKIVYINVSWKKGFDIDHRKFVQLDFTKKLPETLDLIDQKKLGRNRRNEYVLVV